MGAPLVIVMGVSGSGKTTVGVRLAERLGVPFQEGDDLHDAASIEHMRQGLPLDDAARGPWLARIGAWLDARLASEGGGVITCSALRVAAREGLRRDGVRFVYLRVPAPTLVSRVLTRHHPFMPPTLLPSQLAAFEEPTPDEGVLTVEATGDVDANVARIVTLLGATRRRKEV